MMVIRTDTIVFDYDTDFVEPTTNLYLVHKGNYDSCLKYCENAFSNLFNQCEQRHSIVSSFNRNSIYKLSFFGDDRQSMIVTTEWKILSSSSVFNEGNITQTADKCIYVLSGGNKILHVFIDPDEANEFIKDNFNKRQGYRIVSLVCHLDWWYAYGQPRWFWYDEKKGGIGATDAEIPVDSTGILLTHYHQ